MNHFRLTLFLLCLSACTNTSRETTQSDTTSTTEPADRTAVIKKDTLPVTPEGNAISRSVVVERKFSSEEKEDVFKLEVIGENYATATCTFTIQSASGQVLYKESWEGNFLFDYGLGENKTDAEKKAYLLNRIDHFFDEDKFKQPAIAPDATFDQDVSLQANWQFVKKQPNAIGFFYTLGKEDTRGISYLKSTRKVVRFYNCC